MSQRNGKGATAVATENGRDGGQGNRPAHEIRLGRIVGAIWLHSGDDGKVWFNVTISRIYKDEGGKWARSDSFGKNDLPLVVKVADQCHDWMFQQGKEDS